jgi:predicted ABC-type transport system involved in lysophospholipase L1 biosynthesis ATPase subunit
MSHGSLIVLILVKGTTLIIVTHDPIIASQAQRIIHLKDGLVEEVAE